MINNSLINSIKFVGIVVIFFVSTYCQAQQQPSNYNYIINPFIINPAFAGYYEEPEFNAFYKGHFSGVDGAPSSISLSAHGKGWDPKVGLGANVFTDKIGVTRTTGIYGSYAYKLVSKNRNSYTSYGYKPTVFALGIRAGVSIYNEALQSLNLVDDPNFQKNINTVVPSFSFGAYYSKNNFFIGFSIPELVSISFNKMIDVERHFYLNSGYEINTGEYSKLKLNGLLKYVWAAPLQFNGNAILSYKDKFNIGIGYRSVSSVNFMVGFTFIEGLQIAYFYDALLESKPRDMYFNSHELMVSYRFIR